jgi:hypothetical protein
MIEQSTINDIIAKVHEYIDNYEDDNDDDDFERIFAAGRDDSTEKIEADINDTRENARKIVNSLEFKKNFCEFWNNSDKTSRLKSLAEAVGTLLLGSSSLSPVLQATIITLPVIGISFPLLLAPPVIYSVVLLLSGWGVESYCKETKNQ